MHIKRYSILYSHSVFGLTEIITTIVHSNNIYKDNNDGDERKTR